jgi:hypothetical protein
MAQFWPKKAPPVSLSINEGLGELNQRGLCGDAGADLPNNCAYAVEAQRRYLAQRGLAAPVAERRSWRGWSNNFACDRIGTTAIERSRWRRGINKAEVEKQRWPVGHRP